MDDNAENQKPESVKNASARIYQQKQLSHADFEMVFDLTRESKPNLGLPPNAIPGLSVIKELVRGLRYSTVDLLVGRKIQFPFIEKAPDDVCNIVSTYGIELKREVNYSSAGAFLKYGLLDYEFDVVSSDLEPAHQRLRFLKDYGLLPDKANVDDAIFPDAGIGFLEEMLDEVRENKLLFKIFLHSCGEFRGAQARPREEWMNADPNEYFPCEFIVHDACLTNCGSIWLEKHFYL